MSKKPNIVLIFADDLGYGDVSAFNEESKIHTKNIDRLAESGMKFTDSHATSALCTPSRYGLLTGRYNWRSRLKKQVNRGDGGALIEKNRDTLAHLLKDNGYNTAAVGKWHLGMDYTLKDHYDYEQFNISDHAPDEIKEQFGRDGIFDADVGGALLEGTDIDYKAPIKFGPNDMGFDYFFGTAASLDQPPYVYIENNHFVGEPTVLYGLPNMDRTRSDDQQAWQLGPAHVDHNVNEVADDMQNKVLEVLDGFADDDDPFFLYYPNHLVHGPIVPNKEYRGKSGVGPYGDFVLQLDGYVGQIMDKLEELGKKEDTLVIFTSDNGASPVAGFPDLLEQGHNPSYHFKGVKGDIWEGGHREPTIVSYPGVIEAGSESNHMTSHSDFYRTISDMLDIELADDVAEDSVSEYQLWQGDDQAIREDIVHSSMNGGFSIRRDFWKLNLVSDGGGMTAARKNIDDYEFKPIELYDLRDDISETNNVIDQYPDVVEELTEALQDQVINGRTTEGQPQENERNNPTGHWEQLAWMPKYDEYMKHFED